MAKGIKMGVVASKIALADAGLENVDAIITGTGMGCVRDSEKFLSKIINDKEQYLTPTAFIQSTHNTVGGQIALGIKCKGYNFTYVHSSISFESSVLDAKLQLENNEATNILVGGVDELGPDTTELHKLVGHIKEGIIDTSNLLNSTSKGAVFSEGANFFVLSNEKKEASYAEIVAIETYNTLNKTETAIATFLKQNNIEINSIDCVVLGNNGDVDFDKYYQQLQLGIFNNTQQIYYKHLSGEFNTASSFGFWLGAKILKTQTVPAVTKINAIKINAIKNVLLYNQYRGENHSLTLLRKC